MNCFENEWIDGEKSRGVNPIEKCERRNERKRILIIKICHIHLCVCVHIIKVTYT